MSIENLSSCYVLKKAAKTDLFAKESPSGLFSPCDRYRYTLRYPTGIANDRVLLWVLANPSTATPDQLDPTLTRCLDFSRRLRFGIMKVVNVRAWRETNPELLPPDPEAIGPANDAILEYAILDADKIICGWGNLGGERGPVVLKMIRYHRKEAFALKQNSDGSPTHPLYLAANLQPKRMR